LPNPFPAPSPYLSSSRRFSPQSPKCPCLLYFSISLLFPSIDSSLPFESKELQIRRNRMNAFETSLRFGMSCRHALHQRRSSLLYRHHRPGANMPLELRRSVQHIPDAAVRHRRGQLLPGGLRRRMRAERDFREGCAALRCCEPTVGARESKH
jgi:hypothetical protein